MKLDISSNYLRQNVYGIKVRLENQALGSVETLSRGEEGSGASAAKGIARNGLCIADGGGPVLRDRSAYLPSQCFEKVDFQSPYSESAPSLRRMHGLLRLR